MPQLNSDPAERLKRYKAGHNRVLEHCVEFEQLQERTLSCR
jgi:hypothetical protein